MDIATNAAPALPPASTVPEISVSTDIALSTTTAKKGHGCKACGSAPGQVAMSLKAEIAATGADLQVNIQGKLASSLAHGASRESLFLAFAVSVDIGSGEVTEPGAEVPVDEPPVVAEEVAEPAKETDGPTLLDTAPVDDFGLAGAQIALELLTGETGEERPLAA